MADKLTKDELLALAADVLDIESRAVDSLKVRLDDNFVAACELCMQTPGRVVVTGMGKSGHISNKIAATLASTGTPAFFMHPAEASHGDLGMIKDDVVVRDPDSHGFPVVLDGFGNLVAGIQNECVRSRQIGLHHFEGGVVHMPGKI